MAADSESGVELSKIIFGLDSSAPSRQDCEIGSSFASFVNPTDNDENYQIVFHNEALLSMLRMEKLGNAAEQQEFLSSTLF